MSFHVVIVSSGQPSANPRAVKEAISLFEHGYQVTVIYVPISKWADEFDLSLMSRYKQISWIQCGYHRETNLWKYFWSRLRLKIWHFVFKAFGNWNDSAIKSMVLFSQELRKKASSIKADLYIGHNLGALPAIVTAAHKFNAKSIFDFEDYHRGESNPKSLSNMKTIEAEDRYVPYLNGVSFSSIGISRQYHAHFPNLTDTIIRNVFSKNYLAKNEFHQNERPLQLFWFSQKIGKGRGLENVFSAISAFDETEVQFNILGNISDTDFDYFEIIRKNNNLSQGQIKYLKPVPESHLTEVASASHIGLACEPGRDLNNELALSNKIFIYLLAGLAILGSDTQSQCEFLNANEEVGKLFIKENPKSLCEQIQFFLNNPDALMMARKKARDLAVTQLNWEKEQTIFLENVKFVLGSA